MLSTTSVLGSPLPGIAIYNIIMCNHVKRHKAMTMKLPNAGVYIIEAQTEKQKEKGPHFINPTLLFCGFGKLSYLCRRRINIGG